MGLNENKFGIKIELWFKSLIFFKDLLIGLSQYGFRFGSSYILLFSVRLLILSLLDKIFFMLLL